jgi:hypothetical protein
MGDNDRNTYARSWGVCSPNIKSDLHGITDFLNDELTNIIELAEYKRYLMIITNNCNGHIDNLIKINDKDLQYAIDKTYYKLNIKSFDGEYTYESFFNEKLLLHKKYIGITFRLYYNFKNYTDKYFDVHLLKDDNNEIKICYINDNDTILNNENFNAIYKIANYSTHTKQLEYSPTETAKYIHIEINNKKFADEYNVQKGGVLSKNKGKKEVYKSTKQKVSVIIDKKHYNKTVYKNSKGISYIRRNNEYKLLKKYKLSKL